MFLFVPVSVLCFALGIFIFARAETVIRIQQKFYEKINWRIEPISMGVEIRNTKFMGLFLIIFVAGAVAYYMVTLK